MGATDKVWEHVKDVPGVEGIGTDSETIFVYVRHKTAAMRAKKKFRAARTELVKAGFFQNIKAVIIGKLTVGG